MIIRQFRRWNAGFIICLFLFFEFAHFAWGSQGDRLPDFRRCVSVGRRSSAEWMTMLSSTGLRGRELQERRLCDSWEIRQAESWYVLTTFASALHLRILFWTCPSNCDYVCQHIITDQRVSRDPPMLNPIIQYHGKWPFYRIVGIQEPCSVIFSLFNFLAHRDGLSRIYNRIPPDYSLRKYYVVFSYIGLTSWLFSMIFHTRDFNLTEKLDYYAAGASVLYGLYYTPIRIFRLDQKTPSIKQTLLRLWSITCVLLYVAHVTYLTLWSWDYTYNMAANVAAGILQNILWSWFSVKRYQKLKKPWAAWPGLIVAWIVMAMSMEMLDFPPIKGMVDAHSLWHLGTVGPTIWWYR